MTCSFVYSSVWIASCYRWISWCNANSSTTLYVHITLSVCVSSLIQSNSSMHHYECIAVCKEISLQRGRFCARSPASYIPRSSKDRSSWMFFIQVAVCWRKFKDGLAIICNLIHSCKMPQESETTGLNDGWKWWLVGNATDVGISDSRVTVSVCVWLWTLGIRFCHACKLDRSRNTPICHWRCATLSRVSVVSRNSQIYRRQPWSRSLSLWLFASLSLCVCLSVYVLFSDLHTECVCYYLLWLKW